MSEVLTGIHKLVNKENIDRELDIHDLEKSLTNHMRDVELMSNNQSKSVDDELDNLSKMLELDDAGPSVNSGGNLGGNNNFNSVGNNNFNSGSNNFSSNETNNFGIGNDMNDTAPQVQMESPRHLQQTPSNSVSEHSDKLLQQKTFDEEKHDKIKNVMKDMGIANDTQQSYNLDAEKKEDTKTAMLEEIDFLRDELIQFNQSIDKISFVTQSSPYEEIESTLRLLRHKADRLKYCEFAETFLMMGVYGLEELFDGNRNWFGYKPDLRGWSNTVELKLKRMRHDTSQLVGQIMYDYNISPGTRILLELVPNAIIYSRTKKASQFEPKLNNETLFQSSTKKLDNL